MGGITPTSSAFIGFGIELIAYGLYVLLFALSLVCLIWRRHTSSIHFFYLFFTCLLFASCTIHVIIQFNYMYKDLVLHPLPGGILETGTPALLFADAIVTMNDFFAELVLIYRCWVVWERNYYIVALPMLAALAQVSCAMATISLLATYKTAVVPRILVPLGDAAFATPLILNFLVSSMIIGRILYRGRRARSGLITHNGPKPKQNHVKFAIGIIIEAGVIYVITQLVMTTLFALNHNAQILVSNVSVQIYGIAPTLIIVRVSMGPISSPYRQGANDPAYSPRKNTFFSSSGRHATSDSTGQETTLPDQQLVEIKPHNSNNSEYIELSTPPASKQKAPPIMFNDYSV